MWMLILIIITPSVGAKIGLGLRKLPLGFSSVVSYLHGLGHKTLGAQDPFCDKMGLELVSCTQFFVVRAEV